MTQLRILHQGLFPQYQSINFIYVSKTSSQPGGRLIGDTPNKITTKVEFS